MRFDYHQKSEFMIDVIAPWYASYFATWKCYADEEPETVCVLRYTDFCTDPAKALYTALTHAGFFVSLAKCKDALARVWGERKKHRYNKGTSGRGATYFSSLQIERLSRLLSYYPDLDTWLPDLVDDTTAQKRRALEMISA
jgi:hypothetical protein